MRERLNNWFWTIMVLAVFIGGHFGLAFCRPAAAAAGDLIGPDYIIVEDGDTFYLDGHAIRLSSVNAPEPVPYRRDVATMALQSITKGRRVVCRDNGTRSYGRIVADCFLEPDGSSDLSKPWQDIAARLLFLAVVEDMSGTYPRRSPYGPWTPK